MLDKQDQMIHIQQDTVDEINGFRKDSSNYLETEFSDIKRSYRQLKTPFHVKESESNQAMIIFVSFFPKIFLSYQIIYPFEWKLLVKLVMAW